MQRLEALERDQVKDKVAEAHRMCRITMAALQTHFLLHGCDDDAREGRRQVSLDGPVAERVAVGRAAP